jgi:hypothetical protein
LSEKHLIASIEKRFKAMDRKERIAEVRELASRSADDARFIRQAFPALYAEAFPLESEGDASLESSPRPAIHAKRR